MGGGKRTRERALPKNSGPLQKSFWSAQLWIFVHEKQSDDTRGGWKTYRTRAVQNPFSGGVSFVRFPLPSFFHPPMASSERTRPYREMFCDGDRSNLWVSAEWPEPGLLNWGCSLGELCVFSREKNTDVTNFSRVWPPKHTKFSLSGWA